MNVFRLKSLFVLALALLVVSPQALFAQAGADPGTGAQGQGSLPTPAPTPKVDQITSFTAACSLDYIFKDALYKTITDRTCAMLVKFRTTRGNEYLYPAMCTIAKGSRSCVAKVLISSSLKPLPPTETISRVYVASEKLNRAGGLEETRGCTYINGVIADPVFNDRSVFIGAIVEHRLSCAAAPL